jgi:hypothetical protein
VKLTAVPAVAVLLATPCVVVNTGIYVNWSADVTADVPLGVVTRTSTVPLPAGDVAVTEVAELKRKLAAAVPPKLTAVTPVKFVPEMSTLVPPEASPEEGESDVTVGAGVDVPMLQEKLKVTDELFLAGSALPEVPAL